MLLKCYVEIQEKIDELNEILGLKGVDSKIRFCAATLKTIYLAEVENNEIHTIDENIRITLGCDFSVDISFSAWDFFIYGLIEYVKKFECEKFTNLISYLKLIKYLKFG